MQYLLNEVQSLVADRPAIADGGFLELAVEEGGDITNLD
jgi:hypothetical protein